MNPNRMTVHPRMCEQLPSSGKNALTFSDGTGRLKGGTKFRPQPLLTALRPLRYHELPVRKHLC